MSNRVIKLTIVLGTFVILGIFAVQLHWVQKAFYLQDTQFEQSVQISLAHVSQELQQQPQVRVANPFHAIETLSSNYYVLRVSGKIDTSLLSNLLQKEFSRYQEKTNIEYAVYDSSTHKMLYGDFISSDKKEENGLQTQSLASLQKGEYYIGLSFPGIFFRMNGELYWWVFSTIVLVFFLSFFAFAIVVIMKQKRLSEVQKEFINNMTHEFKTPISTISLVAETIKSETQISTASLNTFVQLIKDESDKLNAQVDTILMAGKSRATCLQLKKEKLDLHVLVKETAEAIMASSKKNIQLRYELHAKQTLADGDRLYVMHALQNLLDNAIKYSKDDTIITIRTENKLQALWLSVADNGIGIERRYQKKIFEAFYRIPTGNLHNVRGFGIGLHYVKSIIKAHRWKLALSSEQHKGSIFTLQIPV